MSHQDWNNITFNTVSNNIKKEEVRQSPEFRLNEPITRRFEEDLHAHYGKTGYWKF